MSHELQIVADAEPKVTFELTGLERHHAMDAYVLKLRRIEPGHPDQLIHAIADTLETKQLHALAREWGQR
jgi:hypothetical protein